MTSDTISAEAIEAAAEAFLRESVRRKGELGASSLALLAALEAAAPHMNICMHDDKQGEK